MLGEWHSEQRAQHVQRSCDRKENTAAGDFTHITSCCLDIPTLSNLVGSPIF